MTFSRRLRTVGSAAVCAGLIAGPMIAIAPAAHAAEDPDKPTKAERLYGTNVEFSPKPGAQTPPPVSALAWTLADAKTGEVLAARNPHMQLPPASTQKVLTALTVMPHLIGSSSYSATLKDSAQIGARAGIRSGKAYTVDELLLGMLLPSGNDAASALANAYLGWPGTIAAMNAEAKRIGAVDTTAVNPSGLDKAGQLSSAFDLVTIFRQAMKIPHFREIMLLKTAKFPIGKNSQMTIGSENRLLLHDYPGTIGGKTGYTTRAGRTFVAAAERGDRTLVVSVMRSDGATDQNAEDLLDWGFANAGLTNPVAQLPTPEPVATAPVPVAARQLDQRMVPLDAAPAEANLGAPGSAINTGAETAIDPDPAEQTLASTQNPATLEVNLGPSLLVIAAWALLALMAVIVGLRVWAISKRRRRENKAAAAAAAELAAHHDRAPVDLRSTSARSDDLIR